MYFIYYGFLHFNKNELGSKNVCLLLSVRENFKRESATFLFDNSSETSSIGGVIFTTTALRGRHRPSTGGLAPPLQPSVLKLIRLGAFGALLAVRERRSGGENGSGSAPKAGNVSLLLRFCSGTS